MDYQNSLRTIRSLTITIRKLEEVIDRMTTRLTSHGVRYDKPNVQSSPGSGFEDVLAAIGDISTRQYELIKQRDALISEILPALDVLDDDEAFLIRFRFFGAMTYEEISAAMKHRQIQDLSPEATRKRVQRTIEKIKKHKI